MIEKMERVFLCGLARDKEAILSRRMKSGCVQLSDPASMDGYEEIRDEVEPGSADVMIDRWCQKLVDGFQAGKGMSRRQMRANFDAICADFAAIPVAGEPRIRVGVVGEIYVKFAPLGKFT